jgi:hypothetical protein
MIFLTALEEKLLLIEQFTKVLFRKVREMGIVK